MSITPKTAVSIREKILRNDMNNNKKSSASFLVQGSILAMASIISRMIGLIYRIPLTAILGNKGNDYYGCAFEIYNILLIISSYSLPLAVSKLVSADLALGRKKSVYRVLKCALAFGAISGTAAALVLFFGAEFITETIMKTPYSIFAVKVLVPTLIIVAVLGVLRGFFQGLGTMMPSAVSQVLEQIVNAIVSVWAAYVLSKYGAKVGAVLGNEENYAAAYGAAGGTLGTGMGAFAALLFTIFVLIVYLRIFKHQMSKEHHSRVESYSYIFRILVITTIPVLLSTTIYNCNAILDQALFKNIANMQGYSANDISEWNGIYTGKYKTLINVPISIASALAASSVPALTAAYTNGKKEAVRSQINTAIRFIMIIAFPCAVGMGVLSSPILQLLFQDSTALSANMLRFGSISIVFFSLSTLSNGLLQGINRMREPVKNALIALVLHIGVLVILMLVFRLNIYAVVGANAFFGFLMCILNAHSVKKYSGYHQEIRRTFLIPGVASLLMGVLVWFVYKLLMSLLHVNAIAVIFSILIGAVVYAAILLMLKGLTEAEMRKLPKGAALVRIAKKLHLLN